MLYVIYGTDFKKTKNKFDLLISSLLEKRKDAVLYRTNSLDWNGERFLELITSQALFETKYICALNHIFENTEARDLFLERVKEVNESENVFILLEDSIKKADLELITQNSTKIENHDRKGIEERSTFNIFSITEAFGKRDRKNLWVLFEKAKFEKIATEEIFWKINWQLKSMHIAKNSKDATESGLKPFVYQKSKSFSGNYKDVELGKMSEDLLKIFHDSRLGLRDFDTSLESFILSI